MQQLKNGIFDGPQIRKLVQNENFSDSMNMEKLAAWFVENICSSCRKLFGNNKAENYKKIIWNMLEKLKHFGVSMNIEIHFLYSQLDCFL